jgi:FkbM family methyltransferase
MTTMKDSLRNIAAFIHKPFSLQPRVASLYLKMFRVLKALPDGRWKASIQATIEAVEWPQVILPPARLQLPHGMRTLLVPHMGEFDFSAHMYRRAFYEKEVLSWLVKQSYDLVVEIGANVGWYTVVFSQLWPEARVFAFEPAREPFRRLLENLSLNHCKNVTPLACAVSDDTGFLDFYEPPGHLTNGSLLKGFAEMYGASTVTKTLSVSGRELAQLVEPSKRMLVKIDAEGLEPNILCSLQHIIAAERPDLIVEVVHDAPAQLNEISFLSDYQFYQLWPEGPKEVGKFSLFKYRDYLLLPKYEKRMREHVLQGATEMP